MARSVLWRFYRARPLPSLIICLPGILLVAWYAWNAYAQLDRYRRAVREAAPLALETLHIALHDQLEADVRRMLMAPPPRSVTALHLSLAGATRGLEGVDR